ncbi:hypothetical protein [Variovorax boronicumulans]|uniref:hypothetical protein n=1 Tax=Variovorax boronicumulans TaxID=436515 RepID=UPI001C59FCEC
MNTADRGARGLRDNSPEQLEAMLHVARECSDMERALRPLPPLTADEAEELLMEQLRSRVRPLSPWAVAAVWLVIVASAVALAFAPVSFVRF